MRLELEVTEKQRAFMDCGAAEVLFGGAAGGGKSWGQLIDGLLFALRYPGSRQLVLRKSYPELEKSLIRQALMLYPREAWRYVAARHEGVFCNGSVMDFGFCAGMGDVVRYQSTEYDVIRFDELTHFTEEVYLYLMSRLRGANGYPKQMKSTTNPGGVGHSWVKARFIDGQGEGRVFIPAKVGENRFLMDRDPDYVKRLELLPERERRALLLGDWDLHEGRFFPEFSREAHVVEPFAIPGHWRVFRSIDYGLDMLACLWVAVEPGGRAYVFRELYRPDMVISRAAEEMVKLSGEPVYATLAPPDLWGRRQETGRSAADLFAENGVGLVMSSNRRVDGWLAVKEWLRIREEGPRLRIFAGCRNLVRTLGELQGDPLKPGDAALRPHELTHAPDALRGFCVWWAGAPEEKRPSLAADLLGGGGKTRGWNEDLWEDFG